MWDTFDDRITATRLFDQRNILVLWVALSLAAVILAVITLFVVRLVRKKERIDTLYGVARLDFRGVNGGCDFVTKSSIVSRDSSSAVSNKKIWRNMDGSSVIRISRYN